MRLSRVEVVRESVRQIVPLLAERKIPVTQIGTQARVEYHPRTLDVIAVNLPNLPDDASDELIDAVQGFLDHEVAHLLFSDPKYIKLAQSTKVEAINGILEDTFVERAMRNKFKGSGRNLEKTWQFIQGTVVKEDYERALNSGDPQKIQQSLAVAAFRAWSGQRSAQDFMADKWDKVADLKKVIGDDLIAKIPTLSSSKDCFEASVAIKNRIQEFKRRAEEEQRKREEEQREKEKQQQQGGSSGDSHPDDEESQSDDPSDGSPSDGDSDSESDSNGNSSGGNEEEDDGSDEDEEGEGDKDGEGEQEDEQEGDESDAGGSEDEEDSDGEEDEESDEGAENEDDSEEETNEGEGSNDEEQERDEEEDGEEGDEGDEEDEKAEEGEDEQEGDNEEAESEGEDEEDEKEGDGTDDGADESSDDDDSEDGGREPADVSRDMEAAAFAEGALEGMKPADEVMAGIINAKMAEDLKGFDYYPLTKDFDLIEPFKPEPMPHHDTHQILRELEDECGKMVGMLQKRLERSIAARSYARNVPGFRSGRLHSASLHRVQLGDDRLFRRKIKTRTKDVAVELVVDLSGSMQGDKLRLAMVSALALSMTLDRMNIANEVIGFTTRWRIVGDDVSTKIMEHTGKFVEATGRYPSRIDPIYMPIFKDFNQRLTQERRMALALARYQVGTENNIDGESVEYAAKRLMTRKETRKVMIVLSDGVPAGQGDRGEQCLHLRNTVQMLGKKGVETFGIGIMSKEVAQFYPNYEVIHTADQLPGTVMNALDKMLISK